MPGVSPTILRSPGWQQPSPRQGEAQRARETQGVPAPPSPPRRIKQCRSLGWKGSIWQKSPMWFKQAKVRITRQNTDSIALRCLWFQTLGSREHLCLLDPFQDNTSRFLPHTSPPGSLPHWTQGVKEQCYFHVHLPEQTLKTLAGSNLPLLWYSQRACSMVCLPQCEQGPRSTNNVLDGPAPEEIYSNAWTQLGYGA